MKVLVDADACPNVIKDILFRAAQRTGVQLTLVANQSVKVPPAKNIVSIQVSQGFDVADNEIVRLTEADDLIITSDIPLAAEVLEKGGHVLTPRGQRYTKDNIKPKLNMRDFMETMRSSGMHTGGPSTLGQTDKMEFANSFDRLLTRYHKP